MNDVNNLIDIIKSGGVSVIPTDTLYGIVASVFNETAVERIYKIKNRTPGKPLIVLISDIDDLKKLSVNIEDEDIKVLNSIWPGPFSVELERNGGELSYVNPGNILAVRLPDNSNLIEIIKKTGPLVAPSANPEGLKTASTIKEARGYFGEKVDFYFDGGVLDGEPSTLISLKNGKIEILRQGRGKI